MSLSVALAKYAKAARLSAEAAKLMLEAAEEMVTPEPGEVAPRPPPVNDFDIARAKRALRRVGAKIR